MTFTHLHVRSGFSLLDSTNTIDKLVERADELQFKALALTDEEALYGAVYCYDKCLKHGIKPIICMVVKLIHPDENNEAIILLAKDNGGFEQLMKISTIIQKQQKPGIEIEEIHPFMEGVIGILPIHTSKLATLLHERSEEHTSELQSRGHIVCRLVLEEQKQRVEVCDMIDNEGVEEQRHNPTEPENESKPRTKQNVRKRRERDADEQWEKQYT